MFFLAAAAGQAEQHEMSTNVLLADALSVPMLKRVVRKLHVSGTKVTSCS